jgi:hypothetical protein
MMAVMQAVAPGMMDAMLLRTAFEGQKTDQPKSEEAPDNLFMPMDRYHQVEGDFSDQALPSPYTTLQTNDGLKLAAGGLLAGAALAYVMSRDRNGDRRDRW